MSLLLNVVLDGNFCEHVLSMNPLKQLLVLADASNCMLFLQEGLTAEETATNEPEESNQMQVNIIDSYKILIGSL